MESNVLLSRRNRSLLKKCFKNPMFSLVPFEIWRDLIVSNADFEAMSVVSQSCRALEELVDEIAENNFDLALILRKGDQIPLAKKYLLKCANNNNSLAMFHLGYAYCYSGWGLEINSQKAFQWFQKSAELGNSHALAFYASFLKDGVGVEQNRQLIESDEWAEKALSSGNAFAIGYCNLYGLGTAEDFEQAFSFLEASANEGDEFGQFYLGDCFSSSFGIFNDYQSQFAWHLKAANQGLAQAQYKVGQSYMYGFEVNQAKSIFWLKKALHQRFNNAKLLLEEATCTDLN